MRRNPIVTFLQHSKHRFRRHRGSVENNVNLLYGLGRSQAKLGGKIGALVGIITPRVNYLEQIPVIEGITLFVEVLELPEVLQ